MPLPLPDLVFGSLVDRWNSFSPVVLSPEMRRFGAERLAVSRYRLQSRPVTQKQGALRIGGVGRVTYTALGGDRYWLALLQMLAEFARYSGVGVQTATGMGQARFAIEAVAQRTVVVAVVVVGDEGGGVGQVDRVLDFAEGEHAGQPLAQADQGRQRALRGARILQQQLHLRAGNLVREPWAVVAARLRALEEPRRCGDCWTSCRGFVEEMSGPPRLRSWREFLGDFTKAPAATEVRP